LLKGSTAIHTRFPGTKWLSSISPCKIKSAWNFGIAREFGGVANLRMDDTQSDQEEVE